MGVIASQITSLMIVYSTVHSDADQRKHQSSASLAFVRGIHRGPVNSPHKWPVTRKMFPLDDVIMINALGPDTNVHQWTWSSSVHVIYSCLLSAKPSFEPMIDICELVTEKNQWTLNQERISAYYNAGDYLHVIWWGINKNSTGTWYDKITKVQHRHPGQKYQEQTSEGGGAVRFR